MEQKVSHGAGIHHPGDASSLDQRGTQLTRLVGHVDGGPLHLIPVSPQQSVGLGMDHHTTRGGVAHPRSGRRSRSGARTIQAGGFTWGRSIEPCSNDCAPLNNNCPNPSTLTLSPRRYGLGDPQIIRVPVRTHDASALAYKPGSTGIRASRHPTVRRPTLGSRQDLHDPIRHGHGQNHTDCYCHPGCHQHLLSRSEVGSACSARSIREPASR